MTWGGVADAVGLACLAVGAVMCLTSAIGLLRLPDLYARMHAATKPQALGLMLAMLGLGLRARSGLDVGMLLFVITFQMLTIPVSAQLISRARYRSDEAARAAGQAQGPQDGGADEHTGRSHERIGRADDQTGRADQETPRTPR